MTISLPQDDQSFVSKSEMFETIVSFSAGAVAEQLKLDDISTGASNDIQRATAIARDMVSKYAMSDTRSRLLLLRKRGLHRQRL